MTPDEILTRLAQLKLLRLEFEKVWDDINAYVIPRRTLVTTGMNDPKGQRNDSKVWDGTALDAVKLLAEGMQGYLMSKTSNWFSFRMEDPRIAEVPAIRGWLQESERVLYSVFNRSNLYIQIHEYFINAGSYGTATLYSQLDRRNNRIVFSARHPKEIYITEDMYEISQSYRPDMIVPVQVFMV